MIALDPGHGGTHHGGCFRGLVEKHLNLKLARRTHDTCRALRIPSVMTRMADIRVTWRERYEVAKAANAIGVISIHHNGHPTAPGLRGAETYYWPGNRVTRELAAYSLALMPGEVSTRKAIPATDEPGTEDDWLERPRVVLMAFRELPVLLIEAGYMSNIRDSSTICDPAFVARMADAIAGAVKRFIDLIEEDSRG